MINYFYTYIKNIILFLIFTSFIQVILPNNKYRSYINLVFGIILIFIMTKPLSVIFNNFKNIETITIFNENDFVKDSNIDTKQYENIQNEMIEEAFKENIKTKIEASLQNKYIIKEIETKLYENKYKEVNIDKIDVTLIKNDNKIYVKPFNEDEKINNMKKQEIDSVKKTISKIYQIDENNINITIL